MILDAFPETQSGVQFVTLLLHVKVVAWQNLKLLYVFKLLNLLKLFFCVFLNLSSASSPMDRLTTKHFSANNASLHCVANSGRIVRSFVLFASLMLLFSGCISPMYSRYPMLQASNPASERRSFQEHDPFPDPDIGPDIGGRPREYATPRTETRKAAEQRLLYGISGMPETSPSGNPRGGLRRPLAVY